VKHVANVAGRELRGLFVSPVAYGILSLFSILAGIFFIVSLAYFQESLLRAQQFQATDFLATMNLNDGTIAPFYGSMGVVLLFLVPGITMGFFASEKTNGTQELLLTSPLTMWDIVLGKFAAGAVFTLVLVAIVGAYPWVLWIYGNPGPELGKTLAGLMGLLLLGWTYVSIGCFASSLTRSQVVSFLLCFVILLVLMFLPAMAQLGVAGASEMRDLLRYLSPDVHLEQMMKGLIDTKDLLYFPVMIGTFLVLTKAAVESVRWR
jgi:ABC-2 type transport system permease protein